VKKNNILIISDNEVYNEFLIKTLEKQEFRVLSVSSLKDALKLIPRFVPQLVLTELDLPDSNAVEVCSELRSQQNLEQAYFVVFSEQSDNYIQVASLNSGADDFLVKPVNERLLISKVNSYFRRMNFFKDENEVNGKVSLKIDFDKYVVLKNHREIELPRKEFEILSLLYKNPKKVFSREDIKREIWGAGDKLNSRTIDVHIRKLREKIGDEVIKTIKGVGYKLVQ